jgi:hypothetical protein
MSRLLPIINLEAPVMDKHPGIFLIKAPMAKSFVTLMPVADSI